MAGHVYRVNTGCRVDTCSNNLCSVRRDKITLQTVNTEFVPITTSFSMNRYEYFFSPRVQYKDEHNHVETLSRVQCSKQRLSTWTHARYSLIDKYSTTALSRIQRNTVHRNGAEIHIYQTSMPTLIHPYESSLDA